MVCERLRSALTPFVGTAGVRALMRRALVLANEDEPTLAGVRLLEDGSLAGFGDPGAEEGARRAGARGGVALIARLLDLLIAFIGEPLMLRLLSDAWPDVPAGSLRSRIGDTP
jgi:hypothetical protein